jgi:DNA polymerase-3 subunit delta'
LEILVKFIGNQKIVHLLERSLEKGKIAQAYIFAGPESVGKFTLAKMFARSLINASDTTLLYSKVVKEDLEKKQSELDLMLLKPEQEEKRGVTRAKDIKIEQVREAQKFLLTYPAQGKYKVLIINDAHRMTKSAQNSLLKILEEPNSSSIIMLITHDPMSIIPTIKSRCRLVSFNLVDSHEIKKMVAPEGDDLDGEIEILAAGRPGQTVRLSENRLTAEEWKKALQLLQNLENSSINTRMKEAERLSKNVPVAIKIFELWMWFLRSRNNFSNRELTKAYAKIDSIEKCIQKLRSTNASGRLVIENMLIDI